MLEWKRTKYLARGCFIQEVATAGKQTVVAEWSSLRPEGYRR